MNEMKILQLSETWLAVKAFAEERIAYSQRAIEQRGFDPIKTEFERGAIAALRALLREGEPAQLIRVESPSY
jgi:hypothetical protein